LKAYQIGVDLGTSNILVYVNSKDIIFNEPSIVVFDIDSNKPIAIGRAANRMLGKENKKIKAVKPVEAGAIANIDASKAILEHVFSKLKGKNVEIEKSTLLICCPSEMTLVERNALLNLGYKLGIKNVFIEQEVKSGAIGAGIDIFVPKAHMIIDIGGGSTDIGVLSLGDIVVSDSIRIAGHYIDKAIIKYVRFKYNMEIGEKTAENIKIKLATLRKELKNDKEYKFAGKSIKSHSPCKMVIKQSEVRDILLKVFDAISYKVNSVLRVTPPELAADLLENGILVNGGGALIDGINEYFHTITGLNIRISHNPLTAVAEGTKYLLQNKGNYLVKPKD
jgi:rod shape-determining protein MreB